MSSSGFATYKLVMKQSITITPNSYGKRSTNIKIKTFFEKFNAQIYLNKSSKTKPEANSFLT